MGPSPLVVPVLTVMGLRTPRVPDVVRNMGVSTLGSVLPAVVGALGTVIVGLAGAPQQVVTLLGAWTLVGFLTLTDFGLTRSASKLTSEGHSPVGSVIAALWRAALPLGAGLGLGLVAAVAILDFSHSLFLLTIIPLVSALQFPVVGALEATGGFAILAAQRLANAVFVYLVPALILVVADTTVGVLVSLLVIVAYRMAAVVVLCGQLRVPMRHTLRLAMSRGPGDRPRVHRVLTWVGISSVLGPLMLYGDRVALWWWGVPDSVWVYYVAVSEILIKTYVLPSALLSVLFPWLTRHRDRRAAALRLVFVRAIPLTLAVIVPLAALSALYLPLPLRASTALSAELRMVTALLVAGTVLNWASQAYIAVLQVHDQQRLVVVVQAFFLLPYLAALVLVPVPGAVAPAVAAVWATRIGLTFLALTFAATRLLPATPLLDQKVPLGRTGP
jgi:hypothetical protein